MMESSLACWLVESREVSWGVVYFSGGLAGRAAARDRAGKSTRREEICIVRRGIVKGVVFGLMGCRRLGVN